MSVAVIVNVYKDQQLVPRLLGQIKEHAPECGVIIIGDGVKLENYCKQGVIWFEDERLKAPGQGGQWTQRYLKLYLKHSVANHLLRIDPDTAIWKPFTIPTGEYDLFGSICQRHYKYPFIRGGCIGFTRECAQKLLDSGLLLDKRYKNFTYKRFADPTQEEFAFQDWIIADISFQLGLKLRRWKEINILGSCGIIPERKSYAITHPSI